MEIEDKYFNLLNCFIRDKRTNINGMISSIKIISLIGKYIICYEAFDDRCTYNDIYVEDIEKGNVVFLIPYSTSCFDKNLDKLGKLQKEAIKEFFGDKFRKDMIMEISEEERQEQIRKWEEYIQGLSNWNEKFQIDEMATSEATKNE